MGTYDVITIGKIERYRIQTVVVLCWEGTGKHRCTRTEASADGLEVVSTRDELHLNFESIFSQPANHRITVAIGNLEDLVSNLVSE